MPELEWPSNLLIRASAGSNELETLQRLHAISPGHHLPRLLDHFAHDGPNGIHCYLVLEVLADPVAMFARRMFGRNQLPPAMARWQFSHQLLDILDFLHDTCGFVHTGMSGRSQTNLCRY